MNQFGMSPSAYREELEKSKAEIFATIEQNASADTNAISRQKTNGNNKGRSFRICMIVGGVLAGINLIYTFTNCYGMFCDMSSERSDAAASRFFSGLIITVVIVGLAAVAGAIIESVVQSSSRNKDIMLDQQIAARNNNVPYQKEQVTKDYEQRYINYLTSFENEAKRLSVQYAESSVAKEVVEWMTNGFSAAIDAMDRRPHIKIITVPFVFNVYREKITCNIGVYDFEIHRCAFLNSMLEQAALARALATEMQIKLSMKYPKDISGGDVQIKIEYSYPKDSAAVTLRYQSINGEYQGTKSW